MGRDELAAVRRPVAQARGLSNAHYVSEETFAAERQAVLFDTWSGLCVGADVPNPGDAKPVSFLGMPLLVVRDPKNTIRVFQNTCRHRGMILVEEAGPIRGAIRCPYHSWCYALDGRLVTTPHVGGPGQNTHADVDRETLGLIEIRSHVWRDVVFVNISGTAPDFTDHAADLIARFAEVDKPLYHGGADSRFTFDVACNWKLAVENYCESYHLPWVHPGLNSYSRLEDHYNIEAPGEYSGQGTLVYRPSINAAGERFVDFDGLSPWWDAGAEYVALYPNVLFGVHRDHAYAIILEPVSMDRTIEHVEIYYASAEMTGPDWAEMRRANAKMWYGVFEEDIFVVEGMQRGRHGVHFDGGKFSPVMDSPTHCFHAWVADRLSGETAP
ncbi:MAG: aromatic ring-hydroxylating dioxygenase subunit alpha [Pseudomonadota bacterium]